MFHQSLESIPSVASQGDESAAEPCPSSPAACELDTLLLEVAANHCQQSFKRLHDLTKQRLFHLALRVVRDRDDAREVLQGAYVRIWLQCGQFDASKGRALSWLCSVVSNHAVSSLRYRKARVAVSGAVPNDAVGSEQLTSPEPGPDARLIGAQCERAIRGLLQRVPNLQREALTLAFFDGLSHPEIARQLEQPLGTVKSWIRRSLRGMEATMLAHR